MIFNNVSLFGMEYNLRYRANTRQRGNFPLELTVIKNPRPQGALTCQCGQIIWQFSKKATPGFEPGDKGFADLCLTTWLCRRT